MNKYLVTFIVPSIDLKFDAYIPNNKMIGTIKEKILGYVMEFSDNAFNVKFDKVRMIDKLSGVIYKNNMYVKDSTIRNGTVIILV